MRVMVQCIYYFFLVLLPGFHNMVSSVSRKTESGISDILVVRSMAWYVDISNWIRFEFDSTFDFSMLR